MQSALLIALLLLAPSLDDRVVVEKRAPTTRFVEFDPADPPADVKKLHNGEDALTRMLFNCTIKLKYSTEDGRQRGRDVHLNAALEEVRVTLELTNTIYLPRGANDKLRAHELGHARINGMVYENAEQAAREVAEQALQKRWPGAGGDKSAAGKAATDAAVDWIGGEYLKRTADKAFRIGETYDDLTDHGTNAMNVSDAIREAVKRQSEERR